MKATQGARPSRCKWTLPSKVQMSFLAGILPGIWVFVVTSVVEQLHSWLWIILKRERRVIFMQVEWATKQLGAARHRGQIPLLAGWRGNLHDLMPGAAAVELRLPLPTPCSGGTGSPTGCLIWSATYLIWSRYKFLFFLGWGDDRNLAERLVSIFVLLEQNMLSA